MSKQADFLFAGTRVKPGTQQTVAVELPRLYDRSEVSMPVRVLHGKRPGPCLLVSSAIHGDEVNGLEIVFRLLQEPLIADLSGTLLAVPIVNAYGLVSASRYLPDRRDLNRLFPGSTTGSLTARLARLLLDTLLVSTTHIIDLHTGGLHRSNFPQIRATTDLPHTLRFARAFRPPVILDARARTGSFRQIADKRGIPSLVYETGQALRFDEPGIEIGVAGILRAMAYLGMIPPHPEHDKKAPTVFARHSRWLRAPASGVFRSQCQLGDMIARRASLGTVSDPLGDAVFHVKARQKGIIIGRNNLPLVYQGDPLLHVAEVADLSEAEPALERVSPPTTHV